MAPGKKADIDVLFPEPAEPEEVEVEVEPEPEEPAAEPVPRGRGGTYIKRGGDLFPA